MLKVTHLNYSDISGGAARAANRLHKALNENDVDSFMHVIRAESGDWRVLSTTSKFHRALDKFRPYVAQAFLSSFKTKASYPHSPAILNSYWPKLLNATDVDLVHMHWIGSEMLSIKDICHISKPLVWTLHDMWAFCGSEHCSENLRYIHGYKKDNRPLNESGFDINRWTWMRKAKYWKKPINIITPSKWLSDCVKGSVLMKDWPVSVVPNCLDTDKWAPVDKSFARNMLGLPLGVPILLFGAIGGVNDPNKGFDLLVEALQHLRGEVHDMHISVFGSLAPKHKVEFGFPITYFGHLYDDVSLRLLYSAADVFVIPSRIEAFGQTAVEAHSCGVPVVAFDTSGLKDIVEHGKTGYLAKTFDSYDLAKGISEVLKSQYGLETTIFSNLNQSYLNHLGPLAIKARQRAVDLWSYNVIAKQHVSIYESVINGTN
jgi:glycosyltransferase involved in cell wall biosynthesis